MGLLTQSAAARFVRLLRVMPPFLGVCGATLCIVLRRAAVRYQSIMRNVAQWLSGTVFPCVLRHHRARSPLRAQVWYILSAPPEH